MLGGQPTGRGRLYKDMMDNKQVSIMLELQNCNNIRKRHRLDAHANKVYMRNSQYCAF